MCPRNKLLVFIFRIEPHKTIPIKVNSNFIVSDSFWCVTPPPSILVAKNRNQLFSYYVRGLAVWDGICWVIILVLSAGLTHAFEVNYQSARLVLCWGIDCLLSETTRVIGLCDFNHLDSFWTYLHGGSGFQVSKRVSPNLKALLKSYTPLLHWLKQVIWPNTDSA